MKAVVALLIQFPALGRCKDWVYASIPGDKAIRNDQLKTWEHYHDCGFGRRQSPVDVITKDVASASVLQGVLDPRIQRVPLLMVNTGHGFQLHETSPSHKELVLDTAGYVEAATGQSKGYTRIHDAKYNFYQAHWHTPSEHKIDGKHSIMEAHFVHQLDDSELQFNFSLVGSTHHLAVISVMYNLTEKCNADLELFWDSFPMTANNMAQVDAVVDLQEIMESALQGGYYMFDGSLTTPPCTEGVQWYLAKNMLNVCQAQVDRLRDALAASQRGVRINNRVVQPLNGRVITHTPQIRFTDNAPPTFLSESTQTYLLPSTILLLALSLTILLVLLLVLICILVCKQQTAPILSSFKVNTFRVQTCPLPASAKVSC
uniref:carbonic anhydrase n=1 Tax=Chrysotila carterae TaxID=13221 RepID=A0A7S4BN00_CHRCT